MGQTSARDHLRAATRANHERVDRRFGAYDLARPDDYRRFLVAHRAVLPACEAILAVSGAAALLPDWPLRRRASALDADLASLGVDPDGDRAPGFLPEAPLDAAAAWGMMYVLEGSRLGGAVLARRVADNPDAACRDATRYLTHGHGLRLWPTFVAAFDRSAVVGDNLDAVTASAGATFDRFDAAAGGQPHPAAETIFA